MTLCSKISTGHTSMPRSLCLVFLPTIQKTRNRVNLIQDVAFALTNSDKLDHLDPFTILRHRIADILRIYQGPSYGEDTYERRRVIVMEERGWEGRRLLPTRILLDSGNMEIFDAHATIAMVKHNYQKKIKHPQMT